MCYPFSRSSAYDLAVALAANRFVRIQSKCGRMRDGYVIFNTVGTDHGGGPRDYRRRADLFGVRCSEVGSIFLVPGVIAPRTSMGLRLTPAKNNQRSRIHFAADYEIARWTAERLLAAVEASAALRLNGQLSGRGRGKTETPGGASLTLDAHRRDC
jgi:hypothetical protein